MTPSPRPGPAFGRLTIRRWRRYLLSSTRLAVCSAFLGILPHPAHAEPQAASGTGSTDQLQPAAADVIEYADGRLTIDVVEVPLPTVLREIGKQTGARVQAQGLDAVHVTDEFTKMPLDAAVRRLVAGRNYTLIYGKQHGPDGTVIGRQLKDLQVFGSAAAVSPVSPAVTPGQTRAGRQEAPVAEPPGKAPEPANAASAAPAVATPRRVEPAADPEVSAEHMPRDAPLANPVSAAIVGDDIEPEAAPEMREDEPWVQGYDEDAPMYEDDGFAAEVDADDEGYDDGFYGEQLEELGYDEADGER